MVTIYYTDLSPEKQQELLAEFGVDSPEEMNWKIAPVAVVESEGSEQYKRAHGTHGTHGTQIIGEGPDGLQVRSGGKRYIVK